MFTFCSIQKWGNMLNSSLAQYQKLRLYAFVCEHSRCVYSKQVLQEIALTSSSCSARALCIRIEYIVEVATMYNNEWMPCCLETKQNIQSGSEHIPFDTRKHSTALVMMMVKTKIVFNFECLSQIAPNGTALFHGVNDEIVAFHLSKIDWFLFGVAICVHRMANKM